MSFIASEHAAEAIGAYRLEMLRALPDLAIAAVAGRDSVAAAVEAAREGGFSAILPTSVATGTEYGDADAGLSAVAAMRELLAGEADVLDPVRLGSPRMWAAMNGRFAAEVAARFGVSSPCLACHLYVHLTRVPLSWALGNAPIITGERDTHDGRLKLSQTSASIDAETRVLAYAGVELLTPIRDADSEAVAALVKGWCERPGGLQCVHAANFVRTDGSIQLDRAGYAAYLSEFFEPVGTAIVDAWRVGTLEPDYEDIVLQVLRTASHVPAADTERLH